ncbi:MAG: CDP-alcohol phosphatidyltransferase family protein [Lachnospiraceae bacterium]|nr:CDP-alcohol phosphatidyltransferase family protein [Lachnospiraceae bacterium]
MGMKKPLGYYNYTVVLTYLGMLFSFAGILTSFSGKYLDSIILLMAAGICDMFDGSVASTKPRTDAEKRFGIQIDSLSDLISFGVMPAIFVFMITGQTVLAAFVSALYTLAALIRLAYFNVTEEDRQRQTTEKRKYYNGVPVTTIAVLLPLAYLVQNKFGISGTAGYVVMLVVVGIGFIAPVEIKKPNIVGKICLIIVGITELLSVLFMGWDLV